MSSDKLKQFSPPGGLSDLNPDNQALWSKDYISAWMNNEIAGDVQGPYGPRTPLTQFFNGTITPYDITQKPRAINWIAFPNKVTVAFGADDNTRWQVADSSRIFQDEYLEWSVARDGANNIVSVSYTCEGPEYWQFFAGCERDAAIAEIMRTNDGLIEGASKADFFLQPFDDPQNESKWIYNPYNYWNYTTTTGTICHLTHPANTLGAEIDIAAQATVIRKTPDGKIVTDSDRLIKCSQYGSPTRNSDPRIGSSINALAREGYKVSIADPVALYMNSFNTSNFKLDVNGDQSKLEPVPDSWYEFQRGDITKQQGLRLRVRNNTDAKSGDGKRTLTVSDIWDEEKSTHIQYGAQFADYILMGVAGVAIAGDKPSPAEFCPKPPSQTAQITSLASSALESVLGSKDGKSSAHAFRAGRR